VTRNPLATAVHESGHAILVELLGGTCKSLSIVPSNDGAELGHTLLEFPPDRVKKVVILLAGGCAESKFLGRATDYYYDSSGSDWTQAIKLLYEAGSSRKAVKDLMHRSLGLAASYIDEHWPQIRRLAGRLLVANELDGSTVRSLMREAESTSRRSFQPAAARAPGMARPSGNGISLRFRQSGWEGFSSAVMPSSLREESRSVEACWFSGIDVPRLDYRTGEPYLMTLDPKGVVLDRLNNGAPVLDAHNDGEMANQLGVVDMAWVTGQQYYASLRFSKRPAVDGVWQDIRDRIIQNLSVGFFVHGTQELSPAENGTPRRVLVTKWEPYEISLVPVPADFGATFLRTEQPNWMLDAARRQSQIDLLRLRAA